MGRGGSDERDMLPGPELDEELAGILTAIRKISELGRQVANEEKGESPK